MNIALIRSVEVEIEGLKVQYLRQLDKDPEFAAELAECIVNAEIMLVKMIGEEMGR